MKIKSIRIENFRCFSDEIIELNQYSCFVGPNGAGKSTILAALNVFFREQASSLTDTTKLSNEDYFNKNTTTPVRITITFDDLNQTAQTELSAYVRQGALAITVEAVFDPNLGYGQTKYYGQRLGMNAFRPFFDAEKSGAKAAELQVIFDGLRSHFTDLPIARSKDDKIEALRAYELTRSEKCVLIPSEDNFYGINSTGKLAPFIQWVYVPAVKDACEEGQEGKNTALGKLITRAVRTRTNFDSELEVLKNDTLARYGELLERNQESLSDISNALQRRLAEWAHPNVRFGMEWMSDPNKSVSIQTPIAGIKTGEGDFLGSLARMGNGLQRSYLLALLQELAGSENPDAPTLILACEEPELYQHPPQARHLADVLCELENGNNQIIITTHSPLFVSGEGFEDTRLVRRANTGSFVRGLKYKSLCQRIRSATGEEQNRRLEGLIAKIHQALQPSLAEMFFARIPILVEGLEDVSYITTELHLLGLWSEFRRLGCHLIPANGKDKLIQPLAILMELDLPAFVIFDADGDIQRPDHRQKHESDNSALISLLGATCDPFPVAIEWGPNYTIWQSNLTVTVRKDIGVNYERITNKIRQHYAQEGGLEKNDLFIAEWITTAFVENLHSTNLKQLCESILEFARREDFS